MKLNLRMASDYKGICEDPGKTSSQAHRWEITLLNENEESCTFAYFSDSKQKPELSDAIHFFFTGIAIAESVKTLIEDGEGDFIKQLPYPFNEFTSIHAEKLEGIKRFFGPFYTLFVNEVIEDMIDTIEAIDPKTTH